MNLFNPQKIEEATSLGHLTPYNFLLGTIVPNFNKALQTALRNQVFVHEAIVACALERFHAAKRDYPQTLDELRPAFIDDLPHDPIGGAPFQYRRVDQNHFLLYALGWNGKNDGGNDKLDWAWPNLFENYPKIIHLEKTGQIKK